jgi:capsular exopolysaccharide synthesis family protein
MRADLSTEPLSLEPKRIARSPGAGSAVASWNPRPPDQPPAEWQRYLAAAVRFKWVVLGVTLACTALGVLAAILVKPTYVARATVWVQVPIRPTRDEGPIWSGQLPISSGWMDLLQSYAVLDDVVRGLRLYVAPVEPGDSDVLRSFRIQDVVLPGTYRLEVDPQGQKFTLTAHGRDGVVQEGAVGDSVGPAIGFVWVPAASALTAGRRVDFTVTAPYEATGRLAKQLKVSADLDGNFLRMELGGPDPALISATVNAVANRFVEVAATLKREKLTELARILGAQLAQAQVRLGQTEDSLRVFRVRAVNVYSQGSASVTPNMQYQRDPMFAGLLDVKVSREEARHDRQTIERVLAQVAESGLALDALGMVGSVQRSTELAQALRDLTGKQADLRTLRAHYTEADPAVRRLAAEVGALERQTIPALAGALAGELRVREQQLGERVDAGSADLRKIPPLAVEETRLQRDVTLAEQLVLNLQQRYEEARLAEVSSLSDVRVLDRAAVPQTPAGSLGPILVVLAMIGGLGLGAGGAVLLDHNDRHVHHPDHVTQRMGLAILGAVPHVDWNNGKREESAGQVIEALRGVRLSVAHRHGGDGPVIVTVTSPGRADGKSFVASNLALAFADAGSRTLLIDGDVRRGRLHHVLNRLRRPGLTDILAGVVPLNQAMQATSSSNLSFIGCGARSHAGPALLSSAAMVQLVGQLRREFDAIIVDSAPLGAGADGFALGTATGSLLVVLRTGVSDRELAEAKLGILQHLPINVLGAVLNDVRPGGAYRYYSYYLENYGVRDELNAAEQQVLQDPIAEKPA